MKITWEQEDRDKVAGRLKDYGISVSEERISEVLHNVEATFVTDALANEIDYMIEEFEADA